MTSPAAVHWILRVSAAACFIGHGAFGIITKASWLPFFALFGIGPDAAYTLMPIVGGVDITLGLAVLIQPRPIYLAYMAVWAAFTAALRPASGDLVWEMLERGGNVAAPLALLAMSELPRSVRGWVARLTVPQTIRVPAATVVSISTALLLVGHGALNLSGKQLLVSHARLAGFDDPGFAMAGLGAIEILLAIALVVRPSIGLAAGIGIWKVVTEAAYLFDGSPAWEFIERSGSYGAPLALAFALGAGARPRMSFGRISGSNRRIVAAPRSVAALVMGVVASAVLATAGGAQGEGDGHDHRPLSVAGALSAAELTARLQAGGLAIACRHAITDQSRQDQQPIDYTSRALQRNLSPEGERQATRLGERVRAAKIPIGDVYANPFFRTRESATLAFGKVSVVDSLGKSGVLGRMLRVPVPSGTNHVYMTRVGMLSTALRGLVSGEFGEGDCVVVESKPPGLQVLGILLPSDAKPDAALATKAVQQGRAAR